jgi:hypothetical protein
LAVNRRHFLALAGSSLFVPEVEPVRAYSFVGGWNAVTAWITIDGKRAFEVTERQQLGSVGVTTSGKLVEVEVVDPERYRPFGVSVDQHYRQSLWPMDVAIFFGPMKREADA